MFYLVKHISEEPRPPLEPLWRNFTFENHGCRDWGVQKKMKIECIRPKNSIYWAPVEAKNVTSLWPQIPNLKLPDRREKNAPRDPGP